MGTMKASRVLQAALVSLVASSCGESFRPPTYVDGLRVLAIQAEPPELLPGDGEAFSRISALVADPSQLDDPERKVLVAYISCTPDPASAAPSICSAIATLRDPATLGEHLPANLCDGGEAPAGRGSGDRMEFVGLEECGHVEGCEPARIQVEGVTVPLPPPTYRLPEGVRFDGLPKSHPAYVRGEQAMILALAVVATSEELAEGIDATDECTLASSLATRFFSLLKGRERVTAIKRVQLRGPGQVDEPNRNPTVVGILSKGVPLPENPGEPWPKVASFASGDSASLHPRHPSPGVDEDGLPLPLESLYQRFTRYRVDGTKISEETETWVYSWFATAGTIEGRRTRDGWMEWRAPVGGDDDPIPPSKRAFLYVVVRDGRGGTDWVKREVRVRP